MGKRKRKGWKIVLRSLLLSVLVPSIGVEPKDLTRTLKLTDFNLHAVLAITQKCGVHFVK